MADLGVEKFAAPDWVMQGLLGTMYLGFPLVLAWTWRHGLDLPSLNFDDGDGELEKPGMGISKSGAAANKPAPPNSIAVLPFANMSGSEDNEYFSDGLSEELLNLLAKIPEMQVSARTSSFSFKGKNEDIREIGQQLGVAHLLEGSVRQAGEQVRVTAQLIKASDGFHLWSETFDRQLINIFAVQDEISLAVVAALKINMLGETPKALATNPEAYRLYLLGKYQIGLFDIDSVQASLTSFSAALDIDPNYSPALIGKGTAYLYQLNQHVLPKEEGLPLARAAIKRAMEIDPDSGEAYSALAFLSSIYDQDWPKAKTTIEKALELDPGNAVVVRRAAGILQALGQLDRAEELARQAVSLNPLGAMEISTLAAILVSKGDYSEAISAGYQALKIHENINHVRLYMAIAALQQGDTVLATEFATAETHPDSALVAQCLTAYAAKDEQADALLERLLEKPAEEDPYLTAQVYAFRGDTESALSWLERAADIQDGNLFWILTDPLLKNLHSEPRWNQVVDKVGLRLM